jgi:hypothetical protein
MAGLESLKQAVNLGTALAPMTPEETKFTGEWSDEVALGIVKADIDAAISYEQAKSFVTSIEVADDLIRGYVRVRPWPNTDKPRSALSMPVVLEAVEKIMPALHLSIWGSGKDPFQCEAIGKTKPEAAAPWKTLLRWAVKVSDFKEGSRLTMKNILQYGFGAGFHGWEINDVQKRKYVKDANGKVVRDKTVKSEQLLKPTYEAANLRNTVFDPCTPSQDPRKGRFVAKRIPITAYDLDKMRDDDTYKNIPTQEELRTILANKEEPAKDAMIALKPNQTRDLQAQQDNIPASKDPLQAPLELIEYRTDDRVITLLQQAIVIRNEMIDNKEEGKSVVGCCFIDVLNSLFGFGIARLLNGEQRLQQGVVNTWIDSLALVLNPAFQNVKGTLGNGNQNISVAPGRVVTVEGELKPLVTTDVSETASNAIESSSNRAFKRVGAEGGTNMPTQAMRTGSGVQAFQGDITQRLQYFLEQYIDLVFLPVLKAFLCHIKEHITPEQIQQILSDEEGKEYAGEPLDIYNADVKVDIIAGVKLTTKQAAAQAAPMILNVLATQAVQSSLQVQAKKFNYALFAEEYLELMGWDVEQLFVDMTKDDLDRAAQQNQAAIRNQGNLQLEQKKHANDLDSVDAKGAQQAQLAVLRSSLKVDEQHGLNALDAGGPNNGTGNPGTGQ